MSLKCPYCLLTAAAIAIGLAGCGDSSPPPTETRPASPAKQPAKAGISQATKDEIGRQGDYLPPLNDRRVEIAVPQDWVPAPRDKKYVVQFIPRVGASYPRIMVKAKSAAGRAELTSQSAGEFAAEFREEFARAGDDEEDDDAAAASQPAVRPLKIGDRYWVETVRKAHAKNVPLERWILATIVGDQRYTLELRVYVGRLDESRPQALAVAHSLRPAATATAEPPPAAE
ncbi:MAG: hypothetical protein AB7O62_06155 [Pirellulales bacterium]